MRERRRGAIVNITSVVGRLAALAQSPYVTSKWAFEGLSEGLAQEVAPFGIRVAIVEPGVTKSAIFAKNLEMPNLTGAYDDAYRRMFQMYAAGLAHAGNDMVAALENQAGQAQPDAAAGTRDQPCRHARNSRVNAKCGSLNPRMATLLTVSARSTRWPKRGYWLRAHFAFNRASISSSTISLSSA